MRCPALSLQISFSPAPKLHRVCVTIVYNLINVFTLTLTLTLTDFAIWP